LYGFTISTISKNGWIIAVWIMKIMKFQKLFVVKGLCKLNEKAERKGRNPATGEDMMLEARRVVTFKCSGKFRERVNEK
jgi:hypothetical protein